MKTPLLVKEAIANNEDGIEAYTNVLSADLAAICRTLRHEISNAMPKATPKIWHGSPVWFIDGNPVVGYNVAGKNVKLLFWNGQALKEPLLQSLGKFMAAQVQFADASEIDITTLRRWLKKAKSSIWDFKGLWKKE